MYSVVLMMAMAGSGDAAAFHNGCGGCYDSCHGCYSSCHGGKGCNGGGLFGFFRKGCSSSCHGCYSSCHGCNSSCYSSCHGSKGCNGGGLFGFFRKGCSSSCHGCYSSCHGCNGYTSCHGYAGCNGCGGVIIEGAPAMPQAAPAITPAAPAVTPPATEEKKEEPKSAQADSAPATIVVTLPADATLTIDGAATRSTSARRIFRTPALPVDGSFSYTFQAELSVEGKPLTISKEVAVRGGQEIEVAFTEADMASVASR